MKKLSIIFILLIGLGLLLSCEKEETDPVLYIDQTTAPSLTQPAAGSAFVLKKDSAANIATTFAWNPAVYSLSDLEAVSYILQFDMVDSNFKNKVNLTATKQTEFEISVGDLNQHAIKVGAPTGEASDFEIRIYASISANSEYTEIYSGATSVTITPYEEVVEAAKLWVPGDYQGWDPATAPNIFDYDNDGVYNGYIYFPEGGTYEFKFTSAPDWKHTNFGFGGEGILDTDPGAGNLSVPDFGGYSVEVDTVNLTWTYELQNWGVIGQWLDWAEDIDMEWDADNQYLHVTVENIPAAEDQRFKFRANDAWDINLGAKDPDDGTLVPGGADIPIPDGGTIKFILRFTTEEPTYEIIQM